MPTTGMTPEYNHNAGNPGRAAAVSIGIDAVPRV